MHILNWYLLIARYLAVKVLNSVKLTDFTSYLYNKVIARNNGYLSIAMKCVLLDCFFD